MVICWSASPMEVPASDPPVTISRCGAPRGARPVRGGRCARPRCAFCWRRCCRPETVGPNRSVRTTPTAAITNSHRTARKASLIKVSVSAFIRLYVLGDRDPWAAWPLAAVPLVVFQCGPCLRSVDTVPAEYQGRAAKCDACAVGEGDPPDRLAVDERAVRRS